MVGMVLVCIVALVVLRSVLYATIRMARRPRQAAIAARPEEIVRLERQLLGEGLPPLFHAIGAAAILNAARPVPPGRREEQTGPVIEGGLVTRDILGSHV
jgi:hypothetical protein